MLKDVAAEDDIACLVFIVAPQVQEALTDADDFLQGTVAIDIIVVLEVRVELCQLRKQFLLVVVLRAGWSTLSHLFLQNY